MLCLSLAIATTATCTLASESAPQSAAGDSRGFSVNPANRNEVLAFWHSVYQASEGYHQRIGWTGNYSGKVGSTSAAFARDIERRINYFRAMSGVPSDIRIDNQRLVVIATEDAHKPAPSTTKASAAQAGAVMLARNYQAPSPVNPAFDHNPPITAAGWSPAAWNGNANGNLAFGSYGPGAITNYMLEELSADVSVSSWNSLVGHRRWLLLPEATHFASGDQPGKLPSFPSSNVLYVTHRDSELRTSVAPAFVCYPPPGFFPAPLNSRFWSISRKNADFSKARVMVTDAQGKSVAIRQLRANGSYGHPALIWEVTGAAASASHYADRSFSVRVSGINGPDIPTSHEYRVTLVHPDRLTSNQSLSGTSRPKANGSSPYVFTPPPAAEALRITAFRIAKATWTEGAEKSPSPRVIANTSPIYDVLADGSNKNGHAVFSGKRSFNLTFPDLYDPATNRLPEQSLLINRLILPRSNSTLQFSYRRGFMTKTSQLIPQYSPDGGVSWKALGQPIRGLSDNKLDAGIRSASLRLPPSKIPVMVRFLYTAPPATPVYTHAAAPNLPTGIFIDDIRVQNCDSLEPVRTTTLPASAKTFTLNSRSAGARLKPGDRWALALSTRLGNRWFPIGPLTRLEIAQP